MKEMTSKSKKHDMEIDKNTMTSKVTKEIMMSKATKVVFVAFDIVVLYTSSVVAFSSLSTSLFLSSLATSTFSFHRFRCCFFVAGQELGCPRSGQQAALIRDRVLATPTISSSSLPRFADWPSRAPGYRKAPTESPWMSPTRRLRLTGGGGHEPSVPLGCASKNQTLNDVRSGKIAHAAAYTIKLLQVLGFDPSTCDYIKNTVP